jgi:protein phosphatase 2C-like protein
MRFAGRIPKQGHRSADCEDRFSASRLRFAVADGASDSGYSQQWARILADSFCRPPAFEISPEALDVWLGRCRAEWRRWAREHAQGDLPWFARESLRAGGFATFAGLAFSPAEGETDATAWHAVACGDACVFIVRNDRLAGAFPVGDGTGFDNTPPLVPTSQLSGGDGLRTTTGRARSGDAFYLATDALARWFLTDHDRGAKPWLALDGVATWRDLDIFVSASREAHALKNDDVTLISIVMVPER